MSKPKKVMTVSKEVSMEGGSNYINLNLSDELNSLLNKAAINLSVKTGKIISKRAYVLHALEAKIKEDLI